MNRHEFELAYLGSWSNAVPRDGEPCSLGCSGHITHPCDKCGRVAMMSAERCFVLAGHYSQYLFYMNKYLLDDYTFPYLGNVRFLLIYLHQGVVVLRYGTWYERSDGHSIVDYCLARGIRMLDVE